MLPTSVFNNQSESASNGPNQTSKRKNGQRKNQNQRSNETTGNPTVTNRDNNKARYHNKKSRRFQSNVAPTESGFKPRSYESRTIPSYLLPPSRSVRHQDREPDSWDLQNQQIMLDVEKATPDLQTLYEKLQQMREIERVEMENRGYVDKENTKKTLDKAISFVGSCPDMCPTFERVRRTYENNVKQLEKDPISGKTTREYAIKAFSRPAAGQPPSLPSDVRPPAVLRRTLYYIIDNVVPKLPGSHSFLWDRTRSIRQDFTYQNYSGPEAIECNELIVRIHILSLHIMAGSDADYSQQQELEQMNKALQTLTEFYAECRKNGIDDPSCREAEMRAYQLISHLRDPDMEQQIQRQLPSEKWNDPIMQYALRFRTLLQQNNVTERGFVNTENAPNLFTDFFYAIKHDPNVPILLACLTECHFNSIRINALKAMAKSYHSRGKPFPISQLTEMLGFNDDNETSDFCLHYELAVFNDDDGISCVDFSSLSFDKIAAASPRNQAYSAVTNARIRKAKSFSELIMPDSRLGEAKPIREVNSFFTRAKIDGQPVKQTVTITPQFTNGSGGFSIPQNGTMSNLFANQNESKNAFGMQLGQPDLFSSNKTKAKKPLATVSNTNLFDKNDSKSSASGQSLFGKSTSADIPKIGTSSLFPNLSGTKEEPAKKTIAASTEPPIKVPEKPKFTDPELIQARDRMLNDVVHEDLNHIVSNAWQKIEKKRKLRAQIIDKMAETIFFEIYGKIYHQATAESLANQMNERHLVKHALRLFKECSSKTLQRKKQREERRKEFDAMAEELAGLHADDFAYRRKKRRNGTPQFDSKRQLPLNDEDQFAFVEEARERLSQLWGPIDWTNRILPTLETRFFRNNWNESDLTIAVYQDNWDGDAPLNAWIQTKFGLNSSTDSKNFSTELFDLTIEKLYNDVGSFQKIAFLICVLDSKHTREQSIEIIKTIFKTVQLNSIFKVDIMLVSWGLNIDQLHDISSAAHDFELSQEDQRWIFCAMTDPPVEDGLPKALNQWVMKYDMIISDYGTEYYKKAERERQQKSIREQQESLKRSAEIKRAELKRSNQHLSAVRSLNQFAITRKTSRIEATPRIVPETLAIPSNILQLNELVARVKKERSKAIKSDG